MKLDPNVRGCGEHACLCAHLQLRLLEQNGRETYLVDLHYGSLSVFGCGLHAQGCELGAVA